MKKNFLRIILAAAAICLFANSGLGAQNGSTSKAFDGDPLCQIFVCRPGS